MVESSSQVIANLAYVIGSDLDLTQLQSMLMHTCGMLTAGSDLGACLKAPDTDSASCAFAGSLACRPNTSNPRDLVIKLNYAFEGAHGQCNGKQDFCMR